MGGCRCTYKNCTSKSDGKTHLFHFPVFDKVRCHEWLTRAGRYDFLNLRVSQLKNRCICQHHFTDDWFMNDKKDKLKLKAVPTLDGPFCDLSKFPKTEIPQNMMGSYPLACEVVENDDFLDRKSNYNLLYSDFLTNDAMDAYKIDVDCNNFTNIENMTPQTNHSITEVFTHRTRSADVTKPRIHQRNKPENDLKHIIVEVPLLKNDPHYAIVTKEEFPKQDVIQPPPQPIKKKSKVRIISEKKITEPDKKIPVPLSSSSFEVVKPSMVLNIKKSNPGSKPNSTENITILNKTIPNKTEKNVNVVDEIIKLFDNDKEEPSMQSSNVPASKQTKTIITELLSTKDSSKLECNIKSNEPNPIHSSKPEETRITEKQSADDLSKFEFNIKLNEPIPVPSSEPKGTSITEIHSANDPSKEFNIQLNESNPPAIVSSPQKKERNKLLSIKNKMSPERAAAINEKRKFNMKLKDIIAEKLSVLDDQGLADKDLLVPKKTQNYCKLRSEKVRTSLSKDPSLPNEHAYIVHYLEARMEKMENLLLNKIDQNTKKIMDLKRTLENEEDDDKPLSKRLSKKGNIREEAHKKKLYQEISKYLTPDCNSLLYEELFINKYDPNESKAAPAKRKRNR